MPRLSKEEREQIPNGPQLKLQGMLYIGATIERLNATCDALESEKAELLAALHRIVVNRVNDGGACNGRCGDRDCSECVARSAIQHAEA